MLASSICSMRCWQAELGKVTFQKSRLSRESILFWLSSSNKCFSWGAVNLPIYTSSPRIIPSVGKRDWTISLNSVKESQSMLTSRTIPDSDTAWSSDAADRLFWLSIFDSSLGYFFTSRLKSGSILAKSAENFFRYFGLWWTFSNGLTSCRLGVNYAWHDARNLVTRR